MAPIQTGTNNTRTPVARGLTSFDVVLPDSRRNSPHADAQDVCFPTECWPQVVFGVTTPASGRLELPVEPVKHRKAAVVGTDSQHPAPGMLDHSPRFVHQLLHYRLDAPTFGRMACVPGKQQGEVEFAHQLKPIGDVGVHALAQSGARGGSANAQGAREESITAEGFNGVKVVLALNQQTEVAFEDVAIGDTFAREGNLVSMRWLIPKRLNHEPE